MPILNLPGVPGEAGIDELRSIVYRLIREIQYLTESGIDTKNMREIGGWLVSKNRLESKDKDVGMSTEDTGGDDVRFFAAPDGALWAFYVTKSGELVAQKATIKGKIDAESGTIGGFTITLDKLTGGATGTIEGGKIIGSEIKTATTGERIELSEGKMRTYNDFNNLNGVQWGNFEGYNFGDLFLYSNGTLAAQIARTLGEWYIHGIGTNSLHLGSPSESNVLAEGSWDFNGETGFNGNVFLAPSAARVGAYTQPNSTATTVPGIVADFNTLLSNLKNMGIIN